MTDRKKDFCSAIFFLAFAILIYAYSFQITLSRADVLGPEFFPRVASVCMAILAVIQIATCVRAKTADQKTVGFNWQANIPVFGTVAILVAYYLLLASVGFVVLTSVYIFLQIFLLYPKGAFREKKKLIAAVLVSLLAPYGIYQLFFHVFVTFLPRGIFP